MDSVATATGEDYSVDFVWYSAGKIGPDGYTIEVKIPFKSLRYARREPVPMGIIFERNVSRLSEAGTLPPLDPARGRTSSSRPGLWSSRHPPLHPPGAPAGPDLRRQRNGPGRDHADGERRSAAQPDG